MEFSAIAFLGSGFCFLYECMYIKREDIVMRLVLHFQKCMMSRICLYLVNDVP
jgi:hypothetical protein